MALPLQLEHQPNNLVISTSLVTLDVKYSYELPLEEVKLILKRGTILPFRIIFSFDFLRCLRKNH